MKITAVFYSAILASTLLVSAGCGNTPPQPSPTAPPPAATLSNATATALPSATPTATVRPPTLTPLPTPTLTPVIAPFLQTTGPYFLYNTQQLDGQEALVMTDADGRGRKLLPLPANAHLWAKYAPLEKSVSPDGRWLAFQSGSAGDCYASGGLDAPFIMYPPFDLALNLMDLTTGQTQLLTPLLSANYPENFTETVQLLEADGVFPATGVLGFEDRNMAQMLCEPFVEGIHALAWSPDGRYLAFAGQIDGPSSDLYVYDTKHNAIQRLSFGKEQIQTIDWSPDGRWIVYSSTYFFALGQTNNYYAVALDGTQKSLPAGIWATGEWLTPARVLLWDSANVKGDYNLRWLDLETGQIQTVWPGSFTRFVIDPENQVALLQGYKTVQGEGEIEDHADLYRVDLTTGNKQMVTIAGLSSYFIGVEYVGQADQRFMVRHYASQGQIITTDKAFFVLTDGTVQKTDYPVGDLTLAPNFSAAAVFTNTLQVYTPNAGLVQSLAYGTAPDTIRRVSWRPDAQGLFYMAYVNGLALFAVDLPTGAVYQIDHDLPQGSDLSYIWLPGQ